MPGAAASPFAFLMIMIWWAGVVLLGLALAYAVVRAGRLRRDERARLDRTTQAMVDEDARARAVSQERTPRSTVPRPGPRPALLDQFALPGSVAFIAIVLMILATAKSPEPANQVTPAQATQNRAGGQQQPAQRSRGSATSRAAIAHADPRSPDQAAVSDDVATTTQIARPGTPSVFRH